MVLSGIKVIWAHHALLEGNYRQTGKDNVLLWDLVSIFTILQALNIMRQVLYLLIEFTALFFIATGFYSPHVIVGTIFLLVTWFIILRGI